MRWREKSSNQPKKVRDGSMEFWEITYRGKAGGTESRFHTVEKHFRLCVRFWNDHFWTSHFWQPRLQIQRLRGPVLEHFFGTFFFGNFSKSMSLVVEGFNKNHRYFRKVDILAVSDSGEMIGSSWKWSKLQIYPVSNSGEPIEKHEMSQNEKKHCNNIKERWSVRDFTFSKRCNLVVP